MRILIIKSSSLGDIIHALPVLSYLREVAPGATIDWVVEGQFRSLLSHNPLINRLHVVNTRGWRKALFAKESWQGIAELVSGLRATGYDLIFDLQGNLKSGLLCLFAKGGVKVGFTADQLQERINLLFTNRRIPFRPEDNSAVSRYLRVVSALFDRDYIGMELSGRIYAAEGDQEVAAAYLARLPAGPKVLLQVGTTWETKYWYPEGWIDLSRRILAELPDATLLINWGSQQEKELAERIKGEVGDAVQLLPWFKVDQLIPLIAMVDLVMGGDTGPVYMAGAMGTPTVSFYRATLAQLYAPSGPLHRSIQAPMDCTGCGRTSCAKDRQCRESITVDQMTEAALSLLKK